MSNAIKGLKQCDARCSKFVVLLRTFGERPTVDSIARASAMKQAGRELQLVIAGEAVVTNYSLGKWLRTERRALPTNWVVASNKGTPSSASFQVVT